MTFVIGLDVYVIHKYTQCRPTICPSAHISLLSCFMTYQLLTVDMVQSIKEKEGGGTIDQSQFETSKQYLEALRHCIRHVLPT